MICGDFFNSRKNQSGQTMTEYIIILPLLLLLILGVIQFALIYQAKSSLNLATFMGARQGALMNAKKSAIKQGLASGMAPFFMRTSSKAELSDVSKARLIAAIEVFNEKTTHVNILSPTLAAFKEFNNTNTGGIPNDNLMFRDPSPGESGMSIQDANLLKIRVTYCVKLIVPFVNRVIYSLSQGFSGVKNLTNVSYAVTPRPTETVSCPDDDGVSQVVQSITSSMPSGVSIAEDERDVAFQWLVDFLPKAPLLNWRIDGMRIPITSEAIVRMQSPVTF
jgi:hypothetical protein